MELPHFKYHPDPITTEVICASHMECACCGQTRDYIYTGPVYAERDLSNCLCPWCIADGTAHQKFDARFVDPDVIGGYGGWDTVSKQVVEEVSCCTPGFSGWQQEMWWTHCADAAEFVGVAGYTELQQHGEEAVQFMREVFSRETNLQGQELDDHFKAFDRNSGPSAYVFCCRHCRKLGGYWDCH
jgi:uncharacterized protein CbrC (UPF0167 family)